MASNINPTNIDGSFPVAGQDNDSQGFRNNFTNISNNFTIAASEIGDLQSKAILSSALTTVPGSGVNNMGGGPITNVTLGQVGYSLNNQGTLSGSVNLDISSGNIQEITTGGSITMGFTNWPAAGKYASAVLWLNVTATNYTLTVPSGVTSASLAQIAGANATNNVISFATTGTYIFEFMSLDGGSTFYIRDVTRNYNNIQANLTVTGGYINPNYIHVVTTTGSTTTANIMYTTWYIDSASSATLSTQTIFVPYSGVEDGRTLTISALCPITTTTFTGANIKYATSGIFSGGNITLKLQYSTSGNVWYKY